MHCYKLIVYWLGKDMWPATGRIVLLNNNQTIVDLASIRNRAAIRKDLKASAESSDWTSTRNAKTAQSSDPGALATTVAGAHWFRRLRPPA